jgi:hypothetical protein
MALEVSLVRETVPLIGVPATTRVRSSLTRIVIGALFLWFLLEVLAPTGPDPEVAAINMMARPRVVTKRVHTLTA